MSRRVTVQYFKFPHDLHWRHDLAWLGEDAHGVWLGAEVGTTVQRGVEPPIIMTRRFVQLITPDRWWTALFNGPGDHDMAVYVDVTTVPRWVGPDRVELIDLDLDVIRRWDGSVYIDDEDEFEEHRVARAYPPRMVASARASAARLVLDIESLVSPFDGTGEKWLAMVT
ncbi:MAG: DUF402 domain-containing protein [Acidimicrobiia bacterium]